MNNTKKQQVDFQWLWRSTCCFYWFLSLNTRFDIWFKGCVCWFMFFLLYFISVFLHFF